MEGPKLQKVNYKKVKIQEPLYSSNRMLDRYRFNLNPKK